jgi:4a-hydroxytetrahydrobiopterin dehydratase
MATMATLASMSCVPCRGGEPQVTDMELAEYRQQVPEWQVTEVNGERRLQRLFRFDDFAHALAFTNKVGALAEAEGHHPAILTEWGRVTVTWWTHAIGGLHRNDFVMAAKSDQAYTTAEGRK